MKIRARVILVIISISSVIVLISVLAGTGYTRGSIEEYMEADMLVVADIADRFISAELELLRREASEAAEDLSAASPAERERILAEQNMLYTKSIGISIFSRDGKTVLDVGDSRTFPELTQNEAIQKAFSGMASFTTSVETKNGITFYLATPIPEETDILLLLTFDGTFFSDMVSVYKVYETGHIFIDDSEGTVIANIRQEWVENRQNFIRLAAEDPQYEPIASVVKHLIAGERGINYYFMDGVQRLCAYRPISGSSDGWCLGIVAPLSEGPSEDVNISYIVIAVVGVLLSLILAIIASNYIRKPFEELAALHQTAEADSQAKTSFLAHMSHEIRTPLNVVVGLSELILNNNKSDSETLEQLEKIHTSGMTILSIVNDILDISKIESGKFGLYPVRYDTPSLINDVVTLNVVRIQEKQIPFRLDVDENLPGTLIGDDLRVKQIFNNLLSNAFKYTNAGAVEWKLSFERDGDDVWLISCVRDTGIGILPEDIGKLFTEYNQLDAKISRKVEGTGLGLAITKNLVEMMGGSITVESEYGKGSAFHVRLRQTFAEGNSIGKDVAESLGSLHYTLSKRAKNTRLKRVNLSYARILIVDDIETNLDVVKGILKPYKIGIDCATSGRQAIEMIRSANPRYDAVFMDHMMPGMDGIEAVRIIREEIGTDYARSIPIIALTANAIVGNEEMFLNRGFQAFISKPIDMVKLDAVLKQWVRDKSRNGKVTEGDPDKGNGEDGSPVSDIDGGASQREAPLSVQSSALLGIVINGIDTDQALWRFDNDVSVLIDVLRSYAGNTRPLLTKLKIYLTENRLADYAVVVHGIKGSSYGIFAQEVGRAAETLEKAAEAGEISSVAADHAAFGKLAEALLDDIDLALAEIDAAAEKPVIQAPDASLLAELRGACEAFEMDRVDAAMERLEVFQYEEDGDLVLWLREQVDRAAFEEIINKLKA